MDDEGNPWRSLGNACWFTNLDISKRHEDMVLYKTYTPEEYPTYANLTASRLPHGTHSGRLQGAMGVPITFLDKYNPDQFEIIGNSRELGVPMSSIAPKGSFAQADRVLSSQRGRHLPADVRPARH